MVLSVVPESYLIAIKPPELEICPKGDLLKRFKRGASLR